MRQARFAPLAGVLILALMFSLQASFVTPIVDENDGDSDVDIGEEEIIISQSSGRGNSDLIIYSVSASWTTSEAGESEYVSVRLKNQGTDSSGSFYWGI